MYFFVQLFETTARSNSFICARTLTSLRSHHALDDATLMPPKNTCRVQNNKKKKAPRRYRSASSRSSTTDQTYTNKAAKTHPCFFQPHTENISHGRPYIHTQSIHFLWPSTSPPVPLKPAYKCTGTFVPDSTEKPPPRTADTPHACPSRAFRTEGNGAHRRFHDPSSRRRPPRRRPPGRGPGGSRRTLS